MQSLIHAGVAVNKIAPDDVVQNSALYIVRYRGTSNINHGNYNPIVTLHPTHQGLFLA